MKVVELLLEDIVPNEKQPRKFFDDLKIDDLMASIKEKGLMQPIMVRRKGHKYEIIAGERRYRACKKLELKKIPVIIKDATDVETLELALIENIQRENLNLIEKAKAYKELIEEFGLTHQDLSKRIGQERSTVTNTIRLLSLPDIIQEKIGEGAISFGHSKVLLSLETPAEQLNMCERILKESLSVRQVESKVNTILKHKKLDAAEKIDPNVLEVQELLSRKFGTKVKVDYNSKKKSGAVKIDYYSLADLDRILEIINK